MINRPVWLAAAVLAATGLLPPVPLADLGTPG